MKKTLLFILITFVSLTLSAQQEYSLKFKIKNLPQGDTVYLGNYLGQSLYYFDTTYVGKNGTFEFKNTDMKHGVYAVIVSLKPVKYFEILVAENKIEIESDYNTVRESVAIKKSEENKIFYNYIAFLNKQTLLKNPLLEKKKDTENEAEIKQINQDIVAIDNDVINYQKELITKHPNTYVAKLVKMSLEPSPVEEIPAGVTDTAMFRYMYYRTHYFDNIDLKDDALARTPIYHQRLDNYFMKVIPQDPDTIIKEAFAFIDKLNQGGDMFKYTVNHLTYAHVKTKRMGMDKVYFRMAERYYLSGKADWASEEGIKKMREDVNKLKNVLIGNFAPNIILADTTEEKFVSLYEMPNKYTVLYFWDWTCGHCKKETPQLKKFYDSIKANTNIDLGIYAVCTKLENDGWRKFIREHDLNFTNVSDFPNLTENPEKYGMTIIEIDGQKTLTRNEKGITLNFQNTYDVFVTPQIFLLDANKKIVAKQITIEQLGDLLNHLEKKK